MTVALVTGAAGGIGRAVAAHLARDGGHVVAVDRDVRVLAAFDGPPGRVTARVVDVTDEDAVEALVADVEATLGPVTRLVSAAGVLRPAPVLEVALSDVVETFAVNVVGTVLVCRAVAARMVARGGGSIVTVASNAARVPRAGMSVYAASKAAAEMFTRCLALETARYGVRCNVVAPGSTDTPMLRALWDQGGSESATVDGDLATYRTGIPLGRVASPQDVAQVVAFLLSDDARHMTMQSLTVDGGAALGA